MVSLRFHDNQQELLERKVYLSDWPNVTLKLENNKRK